MNNIADEIEKERVDKGWLTRLFEKCLYHATPEIREVVADTIIEQLEKDRKQLQEQAMSWQESWAEAQRNVQQLREELGQVKEQRDKVLREWNESMNTSQSLVETIESLRSENAEMREVINETYEILDGFYNGNRIREELRSIAGEVKMLHGMTNKYLPKAPDSTAHAQTDKGELNHG